jgi:hypothetical protein
VPENNINVRPHLFLPRVEIEPERKRKPGFILVPPKPFVGHGQQIDTQVSSILQQFESRAPERPAGIDPRLLLKVRLEKAGAIPEDEWLRNRLSVVSEEADAVTVLLASDFELKEFRRRLTEYKRGPRSERKRQTHSARLDNLPSGIEIPGHLRERAGYDVNEKRLYFVGIMSDEEKNELLSLSSDTEFRRAVSQIFDKSQTPPHASLFNAIREVREYGPDDRRGRLLREIEVDESRDYALDMELWYPGSSEEAQQTAARISQFVVREGGRVADSFIGSSVCLLRLIAPGSLIGKLLAIEAVSKLDLPPKPALTLEEVLQFPLGNCLLSQHRAPVLRGCV